MYWKREKSYALLIILLLAALLRTGAAEAYSFEKETVADKNKVWTVTFSEAIDTRTVNESTIYVSDSAGNTVETGLTSPSETQVKIHPAEPYKKGGSYTIFVKGVRSKKNSGLKGGVYTKPFEISAEPEFSFADGYITRYSDDSPKDVVIPREINGQSVIGIKGAAFQGMGITSVVLPEGLRYIEGNAFRNNQISQLTIPSTVETIGDGAFRENRIERLVVPGTVQIVGAYAFYGNQLEELTLEEGIEWIKQWAFSNNKLYDIAIPKSLFQSSKMRLENNVFTSNNLRNIRFPENMTYIPVELFNYNQLSAVEIPNRVQRIYWGAFRNNQLKNVVIPDSVTRIEDDAFINNPPLLKVSVPNGTSISPWAFNKHTEIIRRP